MPEPVRGARSALLAAACAGLAVPVGAQTWRLDPGISSQLTWTSNADLGAATGHEDVILEVRPRIAIHGEGARLKIDGAVALNGIGYARDSFDSEILPQIDLNARLEAIERFFFVEARYRATQTSEDPFGVRTDVTSLGNTLTTTEAHLAPYIEGAAGPHLRYSVRSDNSWVREIGVADNASASAGYFGRHAALIERDPLPLGGRLTAERNNTRYDNSAQPSITLDEARAVLTYAAGSDLTLGLRAGRDRHNFEGETRTDNFYGGELTWKPSPRTTLDAFREDRFFGHAWRLGFDHRQPRVAWRLLTSRGIDTTPESLFELPPTANVAGLLDAMFTTRFPNPADRAREVQNFIDQHHLPTSTQQPINLVDERVSIVTRHEAGVTFTGLRHTLSFSAYYLLTEDAVESGPLATGSATTNNVQRGATLALTHRLGATTGLTASLDWSRINALADAGNDRTAQKGVTLQLNLQPAPKTTAFVGVRYRRLDSNVSVDGSEGAVFAGVDHRF